MHKKHAKKFKQENRIVFDHVICKHINLIDIYPLNVTPLLCEWMDLLICSFLFGIFIPNLYKFNVTNLFWEIAQVHTPVQRSLKDLKSTLRPHHQNWPMTLLIRHAIRSNGYPFPRAVVFVLRRNHWFAITASLFTFYLVSTFRLYQIRAKSLNSVTIKQWKGEH